MNENDKDDQLIQIAKILGDTIHNTFPESRGVMIAFGFVDDNGKSVHYIWTEGGLCYQDASQIMMGLNGSVYNHYIDHSNDKNFT